MEIGSLDPLEHLDRLACESLRADGLPGPGQELRAHASPDRLRLDVVVVCELLGGLGQLQSLVVTSLLADRTGEQRGDEREQVLLTNP